MGQAVMMITVLLFQTLWRTVENVVNSRCECLLFSRTSNKDFGTFNSPDYPRPYPRMIDCILYTFIANANEMVEITFKDFNVYKSSPRCIEGDYVKIFAHVKDGKVNEHTNWDALLCGRYSEVPHVIYSSVPAFVFEFHSGEQNTNSTGFIGTFKFVDKQIYEMDGKKIIGTRCDLLFDSKNNSQSGKFFSPRYPASYQRSSRCTYKFQARPEERIKIIFEEVRFQKGDDSCINREDILKIYDGPNSSSPHVLLLCNHMMEVEVYSSGSQMCVEFVARDRWPGQGFKATYYFQHANDLLDFKEIQQGEFRKNFNGYSSSGIFQRTSGAQNNRIIHSRLQPYPMVRSTCDILIRSTDNLSGTFSSPLYPKSYPSNSRCLFVFQGRGKERIQIVFKDFHLYYSSKQPKMCTGSDSVMIYVKIDGQMERIMTLCGEEKPAPIMSSGPILAVEFIAYYSSSNVRGFTATYHFIKNFGISNGYQLSVLPCAFEYNSTEENKTQTITSPNFPGYYPRNVDCHYFFHGLNKEKVQLEFTYFDVEGFSPCDEHSESDYVELSNYMAHDKLFRRHCGNLSAFTVTSIRSFFRLTFKSNSVLDGTGFKATCRFVSSTVEQRKQLTIASVASLNGFSVTLEFCLPTSVIIIYVISRWKSSF